MKVVRFTFYKESWYYGYKCSEPNDNSGEYVSLAEYQELRQLLERWNEIAPELTIKLASMKTGKTYASLKVELNQLLSDIKEALS